MRGYIEVSDERLERCIRIAFAQIRFIPTPVRATLRERGLWEDVQQTVYLSAVAAYREGLDPDAQTKEISNIAQRELYHFLTTYGFRRGRGEKGYTCREVFYSREGRWSGLFEEDDTEKSHKIFAPAL